MTASPDPNEGLVADTFDPDHPPFVVNPPPDRSTAESDAYAQECVERVLAQREESGTVTAPDRQALLDALRLYRTARQAFLAALGCAASNRDPLAEFAERLAHAVLGGQVATSKVQKGWDLTTDEGKTVQVRYLANPAGTWVNEHLVDFRSPVDLYALLVVEALDAKTLLVFERGSLADVAASLGKRHPNQDVTIQFTRRNYLQILDSEEAFRSLGVQVYRL